jgi:hypothetical protein
MNKSRQNLRTGLGLVLLVALSAAAVVAQSARGTLRGLVTDELGAAVVGANVVLTDATGAKKGATTTNGEGVYVFNSLPPGKYFVQASAEGFAGSDDTPIDLASGQRQTQDLVLKVTIEERVTIAAETPLSTDATSNANPHW